MTGWFKRLAVVGWAVVGVAMASAVCPSAWAQPTARAIAVTDQADKTRVVVELDGEVTVRTFLLADPYRVVVDLSEVAWKLPANTVARSGLVDSMRWGQFKPGTSRLVLVLGSPAKVGGAFVLPPRGEARHRLVVELVPTSREAFLREVKPGGAPPAETAKASEPKAPEPKHEPKADPKTAAVKGKAQPAKPAPPAKKIVAIDAGHGGVDPGATSYSGHHEKNITLNMARELKAALEASGRYKSVLVRDDDVFLPLRERIAIARAAHADLFISLHADAMQSKGVRGASIYTLSEKASDKEAEALAERENKADIIGGLDLSKESREVTTILIDLAQRETMNQSAKFASAVVREFERGDVRLLDKPHRFAGFAVLKSPDMPSVLVELGYLSNPQDEKQLLDKRQRAKVAQGLVRAIDGFFGKK